MKYEGLKNKFIKRIQTRSQDQGQEHDAKK